MTTTSCCDGDGDDEHDTTTTITTPPSPEPDTSAFRTFDYGRIVRSKRFSYLADPLLLRGYSVQRNPRDVLLSLFACHNETVNVWSHLLGGVLFLFLLLSWSSWMTQTGVPWAYMATTPTPETAWAAVRELLERHHPLAIAEALALRIPANVSLASSPFDAFLVAERDHLQMVVNSLAQSLTVEGEKIKAVAETIAGSVAESRDRLAESVAFEGEKIQKSVQEHKARFDEWLDKKTSTMQDAAASFETFLKEERIRAEETMKNLPVAATQALERLIEAEWFQMIQADPVLAAKVAEKFVVDSASNGRRYVIGVHDWLLNEETRTLDSLRQRLAEIESTAIPVWPLVVFCLGGVLCLFGSAMYHLGAGHSKHTHDFLCRIDLGGISFMIWGSFTPLVEYVFYNDMFWKRFYFTMGTVLCTSTLTFSLLPRELMHGWKKARVLSYVTTGMFAMAPLFHAANRWGWDSEEVERYMDGGNLIIVGLMYLLGAIIYVARFPERFWPGMFDFVAASHQIWHLLVFLASLLHYRSVVRLYQWRVLANEDAWCVATNVL